MPEYNTLDDLEPGQRVLVRVDLNSPVEDGVVQDNNRFDRYSETVAALAEADHKVVLMAHQGRPGRDDFVSLDQHAEILEEYVGKPIKFVDDIYGDDAIDAIEALEAGEILLLENTRMADDELPEKPAEEHAESDFVQTLAPLFDAFVNDAYSAAHRAHASTVGFAVELPTYAGLVMDKEYQYNTSVAEKEFDGQVTMLCGGNKSEDVISVVNNLEEKVDTFLVGGLPGELFLRAEGEPVGMDVGDMDLLDDQWEETKGTLEDLVENRRDEFELPVDFAYEDDDGERAEIALEDIEEKDTGYLDIGHETIEAYEPIIRESEAVFVKGAVGVFEDERFADGTVELIKAIGETDCFSVVGGGDTARTLSLYGLDEDDYDHVSIAGGAYLNALTGQELVVVDVLKKYA
ncbi:phosphoglycerate kinase [Halapricum hydrolyticum]|uniref:Phosphoglycerate kinase n=1 Tax=Halapricum hydrolyticum TaxID=2979991 RepID=A0AAE3IC19_9EURY|nr:phosphoglycerate kinase [Halapricum hydrolyticum]MCU4718849.1 phosphoglycerate kinase [Halapricum hydrolyticum]MCU4727873.1 phosphoglycerate kinase [Halapricum hydrolyticum]